MTRGERRTLSAKFKPALWREIITLVAFWLRPSFLTSRERLVEQLRREKNDLAEVVEALRADRVPSEALRQAALRAVLRARPPEVVPANPRDPP